MPANLMILRSGLALVASLFLGGNALVVQAQSRAELELAPPPAAPVPTNKTKVVYRDHYAAPKTETVYRDTLAAPADIYDPDGDWNDKEKVFYLAYNYDSDIAAKPNDNKALRCYRRAAELGNPAGMSHVGDFYQEGRGGVKRNYALARQWYLRAARLGDTSAMLSLGALYRDGEGVKQDKCQAKEWFKKGAAGNNPTCIVELGLGYLYGYCTGKPDKMQGRQWLQKALDMGQLPGATLSAKTAATIAARKLKGL